MDVAPRPRGHVCAILEEERSRAHASGGAYAAGNLWGRLPGSVVVESACVLENFSPGRRRTLTEPPRGGASYLPTGQANRANSQPVGLSIVPPRGGPVKVEAGRKFFQQGRPERAEDIASE